jgi:phospholipase C
MLIRYIQLIIHTISAVMISATPAAAVDVCPCPTTIATIPAIAISTGSHTLVAASSTRAGWARRWFIGSQLRMASPDSVPDVDGSGPLGSPLNRRTLLRAAAGGAGALYAGALPAWARVFSGSALGIRRPDSLPFPSRPAGTPSISQIKHVVVLVMENHSFDNILGMAPYQLPRRSEVDGLTVTRGRVTNFNPGPQGRVRANRAPSPCQEHAVPSQAWNASHQSYDGGRNDGFVRASGPTAMWFWDRRDLPFSYSLARSFPIGQRYFCSTLCQTYPNLRFLFAGTASGTIDDHNGLTIKPANGTIFDRLSAHGISWAGYYQDLASPWLVPGVLTAATSSRFHKFDQFYPDIAAGKLPAFTILNPNYGTTSEENPQDVQVGEQFVARAVRALMRAPTWRNTVIFLTYDEHGGYYDHVAPPRAIKPDSIPPMLQPGDLPGSYDRYGFRVPLIVISPWARKAYVSNVVQDHTSILAFVERKWNLPALTFRDANADAMTDYFDFSKPAFAKPPPLAAAPSLNPGLANCKAQGLNPPLPTTPNDG